MRFFNPKQCAEFIVSSHKAGSPLNPSGFSSLGLVYSYQETDVEYKLPNYPIFGTRVIAPDIRSFCQALNKVLSDGGSVDYLFAFKSNGHLECPIKTGGSKSAAKKIKIQDSGEDLLGDGKKAETEEANSGGEVDLIIPTDNESSGQNKPSDPKEGIEEAQGAPSKDETKELLGDSVSELTELKSPDWIYAESLVKKDLSAYAMEFGVKLDARKSKASMIDTFKVGISSGDTN